MDILNIFYNNPLKPEFIKRKKNIQKKSLKLWRNESKINFRYGADSKNNFLYDNENLMDIKLYSLFK